MTNFIAFRFNDNDFYGPLRQAVTYIVDNMDEELTLESWREFALRGLRAFDMLRRIDNQEAKRDRTSTHEQYFADTLKVTEVTKLDELDGGFEGYVYDKNNMTVFYHGY